MLIFVLSSFPSDICFAFSKISEEKQPHISDTVASRLDSTKINSQSLNGIKTADTVDAISPKENPKTNSHKETEYRTVNKFREWFAKYFWNPFSGILIGLVVAVFGALLYDRINRKVYVSIFHRKKVKSIEELHGLYLQQINPIERISPVYITNCLNTPYLCAKNRHDLISKINSNHETQIIHILITAKTKGEVIGFIKSLYITKIKTLFIAYVAVQPGEASTERRTMRKLLTKLQEFTGEEGPVDWIVFEITYSSDTSSRAKDRLFRQHGQTFGLAIRQIDINYFQPDLDCIDLQKCKEESARLYIASTKEIHSELDASFVRQLIESIYFDIYVPTWLIDHDKKDKSALEKYVNDLTELILCEATEKINLI